MLIADAFIVPGLGLIATGRPDGGTIRVGDRLWLTDGSIRCEVTVGHIKTSFHSSGRDSAAEAGMNAALLLAGVPQGAQVTGWLLSSE